MESTFAAFSTITAMAPSLPLLTISKALHSHFSGARHLRPLLLARSSPASRSLGCFRASRIVSSSSLCYRTLGAAVLPVIRRRLQCLSSSSPSFRSISSGGGGGFGGYNGGSGGGGGGGSDSGDLKAKLGGGVSVPSSDIIILDVGVRSLSLSLDDLKFTSRLLCLTTLMLYLIEGDDMWWLFSKCEENTGKPSKQPLKPKLMLLCMFFTKCSSGYFDLKKKKVFLFSSL